VVAAYDTVGLRYSEVKLLNYSSLLLRAVIVSFPFCQSFDTVSWETEG